MPFWLKPLPRLLSYLGAMVTDGTPMRGASAHDRATRRQAAFLALHGKLRAAYARIEDLEAQMLAGSVFVTPDEVVDPELQARLAAIAPCLAKQKRFGLHSSKLLVSSDVHVLANAARRTLGAWPHVRPEVSREAVGEKA